MNKLIAIIRKDIALRFTSFTDWLFFLILPLIFTFLLAGGTPSGSDDPRLVLAVVDQAATPLSAEIIQSLQQSSSVRPQLIALADAEQQFKDRQIPALLLIPAGFDIETLKAGQAELEFRQQPNNLNAQAAQRAVQIALQRASSALDIANLAVAKAETARPFASQAERQAYFDEALAQARQSLDSAPLRLSVGQAQNKNPVDYDPSINSSAGQLITWVFIPLLGLSAIFAFERQQGTLRRLLTTPTERGTILLGTILGQVLVALVQMTLLVVFGILVMKINWGHDLAGLAVMLVAFALASSALGTTLGTFVKTEGQASGLSTMLGMVMAMLGGCWYPLELFPPVVRTVVHVLPTTWAMQGLLSLTLRRQGLVQILPDAAVLLGFAAVFYIIGIWRFHFE